MCIVHNLYYVKLGESALSCLYQQSSSSQHQEIRSTKNPTRYSQGLKIIKEGSLLS